jgi:hypothetical protein
MLTQADIVAMMRAGGASTEDIQDFINRLGNFGLPDNDTSLNAINVAIDESINRQSQAAEQAQVDIQDRRVEAAGGDPQVLALLDRAFEQNLIDGPTINRLAATFGPTIEEFGFTQDTVDIIRESVGLGPATEGAQFFPLGDPGLRRELEEIGELFGVDRTASTVVPGTEDNPSFSEALAEFGLAYRGMNEAGQIIAVDPASRKEFLYGTNEDGSLFRIGEAPGSGGGGGGGAARVNLQNIGVDKDGFALVFNPATGSITKGPQVGFGQIDPRTIAAEEARQFNEQQSLKEGEFLRDVLSNGRNFLTAAFLSRGQRGGSPLAETTQADLLGRGFGPQQSLGGLNQALGFLSPSDQAKVPGFVLEGLAEQGALGGGGIQFPQLQPGAAPTTVGGSGGVRPGEVDPNTLARPAGATFGQTSSFAIGDKPQTKSLASAQGSGFAPGASSLGEMALAFAPPAVKDIAAGKEVGSLSTSGAGGAIPLASPQTLSNLTADERGALDTTLQVTDQRTLAEFEKEAQQRFRGQGSRLGTRA